MKKLLSMLLLFLIMLPAASAESRFVDNPDGLLSADQVDALESEMAVLCEEFDIDLMLTLIDSTALEADEYLPEFVRNMRGSEVPPDYGVFVVALSNRTYSFQAYGRLDHALYAYGADRIENSILTCLSNDDYSGAFHVWLDSIRAACTPRTSYDIAMDYMGYVALIAMLASLIVVLILRRQLRTAKFERSAARYVKEGSLRLTDRSEFFLYRTVARRRIEKTETGQSNGRSSSGRSGSF